MKSFRFVTKRRRRRADGRKSVFFRPTRPLLERGSPLDPTMFVHVKTPDRESLPLCSIAVTRAPQLILWPVLPLQLSSWAKNDSDRRRFIDHLTLDLRSGKTHSTLYERNKEVQHENVGASLHPLGTAAGFLWLIVAVPVSD